MAGGSTDRFVLRHSTSLSAARVLHGLTWTVTSVFCRASLIAALATGYAGAAASEELSIVVQSGREVADWQDYVSASDDTADFPADPTATEFEPEPELAEASTDARSDSRGDSFDDGSSNVSTPTLRETPTPASFQGVVPGVTTRDDVLREWGMPSSGGASSPSLVYELEGFSDVEVTLNGDEVEAVQVTLSRPIASSELAALLGLGASDPILRRSKNGDLQATRYPERGVALLHDPIDSMANASDGNAAASKSPTDLVYRVEVRKLSADDFVLRAAQASPYAQSAREADLNQALALDSHHTEALLQLSKLNLSQGQAATAERFVARAVEGAPQNRSCQLQWARCLTTLARYDEAVEKTREVLDDSASPPLVRAQALHQMGLLATFGSAEVAKKSVPLQVKCIELADRLAADADVEVSVPAKRLLVDAHLAVAGQVAKGEYENKDEFVAQWIGRASALAEEMIESKAADVSLRLEVAVAALDAGAQLEPPVSPDLWVDEAEEAVTQLRQEIDDEVAMAMIDWRLGTIYGAAAEIAHRLGKPDDALRYGDVATALVAPLEEGRREMPETSFLMGRIYFQIGAVHAVYQNDHAEACRWYDRAVKCLSTPFPVTVLSTPSQHGDALVSMGVSYWHVGQRERAYELTRAGGELIAQAVADGLLSRDSVEVAHDNLVAMGKALGKSESLDLEPKVAPKTQLAKAPNRSPGAGKSPSARTTTARRSRGESPGGAPSARSGAIRR